MFRHMGGRRGNRWWVKARRSLKVRVCWWVSIGGEMVGGGECWAAVGHEVSPGCTPQHDVPHPNLVMMQTKIITLMWMSCFNVHILICDGPKSDKFRLCIVTFYHSGNEFSFTKVRRLEEDMDKASCIARRKLLCREWTAEEIRFIHENLAVLKHNAQSFTKPPSPSPPLHIA